MALRFGMSAVNAVTGIVTARALQPVGRGELAAMVLWPMLFAGLTTCGLPTALVYFMRRDPRRAGAFVGWALLLSHRRRARRHRDRLAPGSDLAAATIRPR